ncbi:hypothetical protein [Nitrosospira sp. Is2]|uniref:hypothetical protein n=1 Tax=Nitrosospira sp. Is2 TaxID=3080532 RepID=UPI0029549048|nr:hypothetical protein [Nitrosospira sp. Is2]WON75232.1 hypothetical protein R5L00_07080 [Nitrosospira sp. Is2]
MTNTASADVIFWAAGISDTSNFANSTAEKYVRGIVKHVQSLTQPHLLLKSNSRENASTSVELSDELRFVTLDQTPEVVDGDVILELLKRFKQDLSTSFVDAFKTPARLPVGLRNEILEFANLPRCWDGDSAEPINGVSIGNALNFLEQYKGQLKFDAFPDPDGSVGLQSDIAPGRVLLSFSADNTVAYLIRKQGAVHRGHGITHNSLNQLLDAIL